jgi:hypothetical protein
MADHPDKGCPYCGGPVVSTCYAYRGQGWLHYWYCDWCGAKSPRTKKGPEVAYKRWRERLKS